METYERDDATVHDNRDMRRMAYTPKLQRRFNLATVFGFACTSGCTWEFAIVTAQFSVTNGGTAGYIWVFVAVMFGMFSVIISLAEMASMAPAAGGQFNWVSEFAPPKMQHILSYGVGWFTAIGWQAVNAGNVLIIAQQIQGLAAFLRQDFAPQGWITSLLMIAVMILVTLVNTHGVRLLPWLETAMLMLHMLGFFAVLVPLWVMGDRSSATEVFTNFQDNSGWGSIGLACMVGLQGPTIALTGGDNIAHLAEETKDASKALPIAMGATTIVNFSSGLIMTITLLFVSGNYSDTIATTTGQPWIATIYAATQSRTATVCFTILLICMFFFCAVNTTTTTSRQLFAFARDGGLPFSERLARVDPTTGLPTNALITTLCITFVLSWIVAGSTIAFNNIMSISLVGLLLSYGTTISTMLYRRGSDVSLPASYLKFPRPLGYAINGFALCFVSIAFVFVLFPTAPNPTAASMNWSILITAVVILVAALYYVVSGKRTFTAPLTRMKREQEGFDLVETSFDKKN